MTRVLLLVASALVLAGLWWLLRPQPRRAPELTTPRGDALAAPSAAELAPAVGLDPAKEPEPKGLEAERVRSARASVRSERAAPRAPVRGRLCLASTGDPIEGVFSVRLRTLDLARKEQLLTALDGTFTSVHSYPRGVLLALVRDGDGRELVDHEADFDPESADEWVVSVPQKTYPTSARGTVIDRRGEPLGEVPIRLVPRRPDLPWSAQYSGEDGRFALKNLLPGSHRLHLAGHWKSQTLDVTLRAGPNELGPLILDEPRSGELRLRFACPADAESPEALVVLRPGSSEREVPFRCFTAEDRGDGIFELVLPRIPVGECVVTVEGLYGRKYEPERAVVSVPGELEVRVSGELRLGPFLRVRDAETGERLLEFAVWRRWHGSWNRIGISNFHGESKGELLLQGDAWIVLADGHRGKRVSGAPDGHDVDVALDRGWGKLLVFEDAEGDSRGNPDFGLTRALLAGVEVFADGQLVGTSDAEGTLLMSDEGPSGVLTYRLPGWRVVMETPSGNLLSVWMARER